MCVVLGTLHILLVVSRIFKRYLKRRKDERAKIPPSAAVDLLAKLPEEIRSLLPQSRPLSKRPASFGVYLGSFGNPPWEFRSPNQTKLLSQWDLVVLDPYQPGVVEAAAESTSAHVLGRLDVSQLDCARELPSTPADAVKLLSEIIRRLTTDFKLKSEPSSPFSGVLLANWHVQLPPVRLNPLLESLKRLNVPVYIELTPPDYMTEGESLLVRLERVAGLICRNTTILPNGDVCNYFQMEEMRRAQRALAKHAWLGGSTFMMLETLDDGVEVSHSVLKRSHNWSRYNSALSWIGPQAALFDADVAERETYRNEPLGALMWLKTTEVQDVQQIWRTNEKILQHPIGAREAFQSLESVIPGLATHLHLETSLRNSATSQHNKPAIMNADFDWSIENPYEKLDVFSYASTGESFTGLGCFQIGLQCTPNDFVGLVEGQRRLRDLNMLSQIPSAELKKMTSPLLDLCRSLPPRHSLTAVIEELVGLLDGSDEDKEGRPRLRVYSGLHSGFHNGSDNMFWGLFDGSDVGPHLDIFLSLKTADRISTLLHTFLSSREFSRRACFQAECALAERTGTMLEEWSLPPRLTQDIQKLTPAENLLLLHRLTRFGCSETDTFETSIASLCESQLLDTPSLVQSRSLSTEEYLQGKVTAEQLIEARLQWLRDQGAERVPTKEGAISVFKDFDARLPGILLRKEAHHLDQIATVFQRVLQKGRIDASVDILAYSVFCAFRKLAVDEIYLEILDRNPMPYVLPLPAQSHMKRLLMAFRLLL